MMNNDWVNAEEEAAEELSWSPRTEQEPVAWRVKRMSHGVESVHYTDDPPNRRSELKEMGFVFEPLFLHPAPKRKPLSEEEVKTELKRKGIGSANFKIAYRMGVRFAEKIHEIGEKDE